MKNKTLISELLKKPENNKLIENSEKIDDSKDIKILDITSTTIKKEKKVHETFSKHKKTEIFSNSEEISKFKNNSFKNPENFKIKNLKVKNVYETFFKQKKTEIFQNLRIFLLKNFLKISK